MMERHFNHTRLEVRSASNPGTSAGTLVGYASIFSTPGNKFGLSEEMPDGWRERIDRRAFDKVLADSNLDTKFLIQHDANQICARAKTGTLKLMTDNVGLRVAADISPTSYGRDLVENVRNGTIDEMSFGFTCDQDDWNEEEIDGARVMVRTVRSIGTLTDVSAVIFPAYRDASITAATQVSSLSPAVMGRAIPNSAPIEFRSRIIEARSHFEARGANRRNFQSLINSL